jgi:prepilin-type N-terminal cleavage/methylation domain-containing protein
MMRTRLSPRRRGMTIIEVLFAIVILSGVMLALSRFGNEFSRASRNGAIIATASDLAGARIEVVRSHTDYSTLISTFNGSTETSGSPDARPSMTGYDGFVRETKVVDSGDDSAHYVTVTVVVTSAQLTRPISQSVVIGVF